MKQKASRFGRIMLKIAILAIALDEVASGAVSPAMGELIAEFGPAHGETMVMLIGTMPQFCLVFVAPIFGLLANRFKRRHLAFFGLACFTLGGFLPRFATDLMVILGFRVVLGIGVAILMPLALVLVDDFFEGPEKNTMIGFNMTIQMLGGTFFQLAGGYLATIHWSQIFDVYLYPIWIIILVFLFVPEPPKRELVARSSEKGLQKQRLPKIIFLLCGVYILYHICFVNLPMNVAVLIESQGYGDAANAGVLLSIMTMGAFAGGLIFGLTYKRLSSNTMVLGMLTIAIGFSFCYFSNGLIMIGIGCLLCGYGTGTVMPSFMSVAIEAAPATRVALSLSLLPASMGLGQFLSPVVSNALLNTFGLSIGRDAMGLGALFSLVLVVLMIALTRVIKKRRENLLVDSVDSSQTTDSSD